VVFRRRLDFANIHAVALAGMLAHFDISLVCQHKEEVELLC